MARVAGWRRPTSISRRSALAARWRHSWPPARLGRSRAGSVARRRQVLGSTQGGRSTSFRCLSREEPADFRRSVGRARVWRPRDSHCSCSQPSRIAPGARPKRRSLNLPPSARATRPHPDQLAPEPDLVQPALLTQQALQASARPNLFALAGSSSAGRASKPSSSSQVSAQQSFTRSSLCSSMSADELFGSQLCWCCFCSKRNIN